MTLCWAPQFVLVKSWAFSAHVTPKVPACYYRPSNEWHILPAFHSGYIFTNSYTNNRGVGRLQAISLDASHAIYRNIFVVTGTHAHTHRGKHAQMHMQCIENNYLDCKQERPCFPLTGQQAADKNQTNPNRLICCESFHSQLAALYLCSE